jgi:hypothetical protein
MAISICFRASSTLDFFLGTSFRQNELAAHFFIGIQAWFGRLGRARLLNVAVLGEARRIDRLSQRWVVSTHPCICLCKLLMACQEMVLCHTGRMVWQSHSVESTWILLMERLLHHLRVSLRVWEATHIRSRRKLIQILSSLLLILMPVWCRLVWGCDQTRSGTQFLSNLNHGSTFTAWASRSHLMTIWNFLTNVLLYSLRCRSIILSCFIRSDIEHTCDARYGSCSRTCCTGLALAYCRWMVVLLLSWSTWGARTFATDYWKEANQVF